jgi:hypothetical protein
MIEIDNKLISDDLFSKKFVCDLQSCKGACCVEGDSGAPLTKGEVNQIEADLGKIRPFMRKEGLSAVDEKGVYYIDQDGDHVTTLVKNKECAFVFFDKNNIAKCAIEKASRENHINFNKPISCHLYPIRVKDYKEFQAINVDQWHICKPACKCGEQLNIPVFKFLKQAIIRKWGAEFFKDLDVVANRYFGQDK